MVVHDTVQTTVNLTAKLPNAKSVTITIPQTSTVSELKATLAEKGAVKSETARVRYPLFGTL